VTIGFVLSCGLSGVDHPIGLTFIG